MGTTHAMLPPNPPPPSFGLSGTRKWPAELEPGLFPFSGCFAKNPLSVPHPISTSYPGPRRSGQDGCVTLGRPSPGPAPSPRVARAPCREEQGSCRHAVRMLGWVRMRDRRAG